MAAVKPVGLGGVGAAVSAEDVLRVARGAPCAPDAAVMEKLQRDEGAQAAKDKVRPPHACVSQT
jgi:hypothetical protein